MRLVSCRSRGCGRTRVTRVSNRKDGAGIFETVKQAAAAEVAAPGVIPFRFDSRRKWPSTTRPSLSAVTDGSPGSHNSYGSELRPSRQLKPQLRNHPTWQEFHDMSTWWHLRHVLPAYHNIYPCTKHSLNGGRHHLSANNHHWSSGTHNHWTLSESERNCPLVLVMPNKIRRRQDEVSKGQQTNSLLANQTTCAFPCLLTRQRVHFATLTCTFPAC